MAGGDRSVRRAAESGRLAPVRAREARNAILHKCEVPLRICGSPLAQLPQCVYYCSRGAVHTERDGMSLSYEVHSRDGLVGVKGTGGVDLREARRLLQEIRRDSAVRPGMDVLVDLTTIEWSPTTRDMRTLVGWLPSLPSAYTGAIAVVVSSSFHFGMARMVAILAGPKNIEIHVYMDMAEARACVRTRQPAPAQ
jgi:hypothetical protein